MDERPLATANQAFKEQDWSLAARAYETVYQTQSTEAINHLLARSLFMAGHVTQALEIALENPESYLTDETHLTWLIEILLANGNLLVANQVVSAINQPALKEGVSQQITAVEHRLLKTSASQGGYQKFYQLAAGDLLQQRMAYEESKALPKRSWVKAATHLLVDPFVKPIVRVTLLEDLRKLKVSEPVWFQWLIGEPRQLTPTDLRPLEDEIVNQKALKTLKAQLGSVDPVSAQLQVESLRIQLALLYPFADEAVADWQTWVALNLGERITASKKNAAIKEWYERVQKILGEMVI